MAGQAAVAQQTEVQGYVGTLFEAVDTGVIAPPQQPMRWGQWKRWRDGDGRRPEGTSLQAEQALWKAFSEDW